MKYSKSHDDLALELQALHAIEELVAYDRDIDLTASFVAQHVGASAAQVRPILSRFAKRGVLLPRIESACEECGISEDTGDTEMVSRFCRECSEEREHHPIVVFSASDPLKDAVQNPKSRRRTMMPRNVRRSYANGDTLKIRCHRTV